MFKRRNRGSDYPERASYIEDVAGAYAREVNKKRSVSRFAVPNPARDCVQNTDASTTAPAKKGRIIFESRFNKDLRGVFSACFSPDGQRFVTGFGSGAIQAWALQDPQYNSVIKESSEHGVPIMAIRFISKDDPKKFFAVGACGFIYNCSMNEQDHRVFAKEADNEINALDINCNGNTLITGGKDSVLRMYDTNNATLIAQYPKPKADIANQNVHKMRIFCVRCHPTNSKLCVSGGWDNCIKVWDMRTQDQAVMNIMGPHICGEAIDIKQNIVLTGSWILNESLQTWDLTTGNLIDTINPTNRPPTVDGEFLYCAKFFPGESNSNLVVSGGSGVGGVEVTNFEAKKVVSTFKVHKSVLALDVYEKYILFGGMESVLKVGEI